jgi:hypothetical protein
MASATGRTAGRTAAASLLTALPRPCGDAHRAPAEPPCAYIGCDTRQQAAAVAREVEQAVEAGAQMPLTATAGSLR